MPGACEPRLPVPPHTCQVRSLQGTLHTLPDPLAISWDRLLVTDTEMARPLASRGLPYGLGNQGDDTMGTNSLIQPMTQKRQSADAEAAPGPLRVEASGPFRFLRQGLPERADSTGHARWGLLSGCPPREHWVSVSCSYEPKPWQPFPLALPQPDSQPP